MQAESFKNSRLSNRLPPIGAARPDIQALATAIGNEVSKGLIDLWHGRVASFLELILFGLFSLAIAFAVGRGSFHQELVAPLLLGFVGYIFFHMQTNRLFWGLLGELQSGTLEQMYLSPFPSWLLTIGLEVASLVEAALTALLLYILTYLVVPVTIPLSWTAVLALVLLAFGSVGYSLILGGLTLLFKRLEILKDMFQTVVLIFGGALVSLDHMPGWMQAIGRLLPLTPGVEALRKTLLEGALFGSLLSDGTLVWMVGITVVYLLFGITIFRWCEGIAKRRGTLGQY